jgi:hypothetical protein
MSFVSPSRIAAFIVVSISAALLLATQVAPNRRAQSIVATASIVRGTTRA